MIKFYNGYSSLTLPRSKWLHYVGTCDPQSRASFDLQGHHLNELGSGPLGDAAYQISKL